MRPTVLDNTIAFASLMKVEPDHICLSPYAGGEIWFGNHRCITVLTDCAYTHDPTGLPGDWYDQGDYWFLDF
jgi:hypothetical protein